MWYLICYDIALNKRRNKAAKLLESLGRRLQKSVFLAELTSSQRQSAQRQLQKLLGSGDSLLFLPFCRQCYDQARYLGPKTSPALVV